jgi:hypothetical protein
MSEDLFLNKTLGVKMRETMCPFCWDKNVRRINGTKKKETSAKGFLMECDSCEKFYWDDTKEQVTALFRRCDTLRLEPEKCSEALGSKLMLDKVNYDRRKIEELDILCGTCPNRIYISDRM